ncbi:MAG: polyprenyl synthetase family protein [Bacteroidota bacterium]
MHSFAQLQELFENRFTKTLPFPGKPENLYDPCRYLLQLGGKRVRPILCLMGAELFGDITEDAWEAAYGVELFHNFTLVHDDIMDNAPLRRGRPTLHDKYGLTAGILCGDVMCIQAYSHLANIGRGLQPILQLFNKTATQVCEGQQMDMDFEQRSDVHIDEYIEMISLKTSVLLACSLKMGALTAGALGDNANKLYTFGKNMGIAFQLQDDYLDAFGDTGKLGKQNGGDIKANKKTYLLINALENADEAQRVNIENLLSGNADNKVKKMLEIFKATGADAGCRKAVEEYSQQAFNCLEEVAIPGKRKQPLLELANYLLLRDK